MGITLEENGTRVSCDICRFEEVTSFPNGVVPATWATGQLWIDISLSEQRQYPLCFCPECKPKLLTELKLSL